MGTYYKSRDIKLYIYYKGTEKYFHTLKIIINELKVNQVSFLYNF